MWKESPTLDSIVIDELENTLNHRLQDGVSDTNIPEPGKKATILQTLQRAEVCHHVPDKLADLLYVTGVSEVDLSK